ncbi:hypothetical protein OG239_41355 [Streptomyces sp. NBC_00868]|uniref:hypothetical protein n=1 Tax=unclassified Streptomyces TaxID=2593676 RepID=UPI003247B247|nr:hypothetical protein OG239_41355 [Streptomyces sp. NBC_00868]
MGGQQDKRQGPGKGREEQRRPQRPGQEPGPPRAHRPSRSGQRPDENNRRREEDPLQGERDGSCSGRAAAAGATSARLPRGPPVDTP